MKNFIRILALTFWFCVSGVAATASSVSADVYGKLPEKSLMAVSSSGNRMAFRDVKKGRDLILVYDFTQDKYVGIADAAEANPTSISFIDENRLLLRSFNNVRLWGYRGRHDVSYASVYDITAQSIYQLLVPGDGIHSGQSNLGNVIGISQDREYAYMPAWKSENQYSLFKVSLKKSRKPRVYKKGTSDTIDFFLNQDDEVIARERYNNRTNLHLIQALHDNKWVDIYSEETAFITKGFSGVTPDGTHLVMRSKDPMTGRWAYYTLSLTDGAISDPLFTHNDKDVEGILTNDSRTVIGVRYSGFKPTYEFFDETLNKRLKGIIAALPDSSVLIKDYTPNLDQILLYVSGDKFAGDYFLYDSGQLAFISSSRPDIPKSLINPVTITQFNARDGLVIPTLITQPKQSNDEPLPTILLPHGGPELYDKYDFDYLAQYFSAQGYVVIQPQFRGSSGFGSKHLLSGRGEWGQKMQDDLTDAVRHFAKQGLVDIDRVCIVGASYGGYAALAGAVFTPDLYKCVVSINGVADVEKMMRTEKRQHGNNHWVVSYWETVITSDKVAENHLKNISPINFVEKIKAPVLLIHGEYDEVVPIKQSKNMFEEMEDADKPVTFVELDKGSHYLMTSQNRMQAMQAIDAFVKKHL